MLDIGTSDGPKPKCFFTTTSLPPKLNEDQPPTKKKPFSTITAHPFNHTLDLLVPEPKATALQQTLQNEACTLHYARVYMKLHDIVSGDFFNRYIKSGNVLMRSEGRAGIDQVFTLCDGILRLEVDKPIYERLGLQGSVIPSGGRKHVKARYAVDLNLRLPSMVRGKKGFERVLWAFDNVLDQSMAWLFHDLKTANDRSGPVSTHQPQWKSIRPEIERVDGAVVPPLRYYPGSGDHEQATELLEWLGLAFHCSPRIRKTDDIDPYLSRYRVPQAAVDQDLSAPAELQNLVRFRWHGFVNAAFTRSIMAHALNSCERTWFSLGVATFDQNAYTILHDDGIALIWEFTG